MNKIKKLTLFVLVILTLFSIVSCGKKNYTLTIGENINVNISNLKKIEENTEVTLTFIVPEGQMIDYLLLNDRKIYDVGKTYRFLINGNTNASVHFKEDLDYNYFKLKLPNYVVADVDDINRIYYDTLVTLTINVPLKRVFKELIVNNKVIKTLTNNTYTFNIEKDTSVKVNFTYEDNYVKVSSLELGTLLMGLKKVSLFKEGVLDVNFNMYYKEDETGGRALVNINEDLEIDELIAELDLNYLDNDLEYSYYYDTLHHYLAIHGEELVKRRYEADYFFIKVDNLEDIFADFDIEFINELSLLNDIFEQTFSLFMGALAYDSRLQDNFVLLKKGNNYKLLITFDEVVIKEIMKEANLEDLDFELPQFKVAIELFFNKSEVTGLNFLLHFGVEELLIINSNMAYTNLTINPPSDLGEYEHTEQVNYHYNIYFGDDAIQLTVKDFVVDLVADLNVSEEVMDEYLEKIGIEGLYTDQLFNNKLKLSDLKNSPLDIYIVFLGDADYD